MKHSKKIAIAGLFMLSAWLQSGAMVKEGVQEKEVPSLKELCVNAIIKFIDPSNKQAEQFCRQLFLSKLLKKPLLPSELDALLTRCLVYHAMGDLPKILKESVVIDEIPALKKLPKGCYSLKNSKTLYYQIHKYSSTAGSNVTIGVEFKGTIHSREIQDILFINLENAIPEKIVGVQVKDIQQGVALIQCWTEGGKIGIAAFDIKPFLQTIKNVVDRYPTAKPEELLRTIKRETIGSGANNLSKPQYILNDVHIRAFDYPCMLVEDSNKKLSLYDIKDGSLICKLNVSVWEHSLHLYDNLLLPHVGDYIVLVGYNGLHFYNRATGEEIHTIQDTHISCAAISADDKRIVTYHTAGRSGQWWAKEIKLWDPLRKEKIAEFELPDFMTKRGVNLKLLRPEKSFMDKKLMVGEHLFDFHTQQFVKDVWKLRSYKHIADNLSLVELAALLHLEYEHTNNNHATTFAREIVKLSPSPLLKKAYESRYFATEKNDESEAELNAKWGYPVSVGSENYTVYDEQSNEYAADEDSLCSIQ